MKVRNRSTSTVGYTVPDLHVNRTFVPGEIKEIPQAELESLVQQPGGRVILTEYLQVSRDDIKKLDVLEPEQEYFYSEEDVKNIMKNAFFMGIANLHFTVLIAIISAIPAVLALFFTYYFLVLLPLWVLGGTSIIVYLNTVLFVKVFDKYIPKEEA